MPKLLSFLLLLVFINVNLSALDDVDLEFEVGVMNASFSGDISNTINTLSFDSDLGIKDSTASFFGVKARFRNKWFPVININYMNFSESKNSVLSGQKIGDTFFSELVESNIKYTVLNSMLYYEFKAKGKRKRMFGKVRYTGDLEIDLGVNFKNIDFFYDVSGTVTKDTEYIKIQSSLLLPYVAMRYYIYNLSLFTNISTLSFSDIKSTSYSFGADYQMIMNFYLGLTYFYEDFEKKILNDTIRFQSSGLMFSVKYNF
ncbi:MAG: hypothetical protein COB17_02285 [Sulfurimonas sp.]|nr:MAG: hypothetical protein COB17_02285 [Sulfurimonas sp.]